MQPLSWWRRSARRIRESRLSLSPPPPRRNPLALRRRERRRCKGRVTDVPPAVPVSPDNAFAALRQFVRKRAAVERCEMCSRELAQQHEHLVELAAQKLICACDACVILFDGQSGAKYKRVPQRVLFLKDFKLSDG